MIQETDFSLDKSVLHGTMVNKSMRLGAVMERSTGKPLRASRENTQEDPFPDDAHEII